MDVASAFSRVFRLAVDGRLEGVCKGGRADLARREILC